MTLASAVREAGVFWRTDTNLLEAKPQQPFGACKPILSPCAEIVVDPKSRR